MSRRYPYRAAILGACGALLLLAVSTAGANPAGATPRLVDLGSRSCIPCRKMAPILDDLREEYAGRMEVSFIDVTDDFEVAKPYRIRIIPTQIFYDADGKELFRHEGFYSRSQILRKWRSLGYTFEDGGQTQ